MSQHAASDVVRAPVAPLSPAAPWRAGAFKRLAGLFWTFASLGLFAGVWETAWALGWLNPLLLPPPHMFLSDIPGTLKYFSFDQVGHRGGDGGVLGLLITIGWTTMRVVVGLCLGFAIGVVVGATIHYSPIARRLLLPTIYILAPISPVAWLPVAIFLFGIGDVPAIFLVFITLFFAIVLSTAAQIESVPKNYLHVARIMAATPHQTFWRVILPAILPSLFVTLRLNLFAAWMVVLIAEAVGVGTGLGQITSMARATFNAKLVFFTMGVIGLLGFAFDWGLRMVQRRLLWWTATGAGGR